MTLREELIKQALENCKVNKYHSVFKEVCLEYDRLLTECMSSLPPKEGGEITAEDFVYEKYGIIRTSADGKVISKRLANISNEKWFSLMETYASLKNNSKEGGEEKRISPNSERNWKEDFSHENGNYQNICIKCEKGFIGHKRRVICKICDNNIRESCLTNK